MTGRIEGDLDYTLRAFPNHPRALWSMARLHIREKTTHLAGATYSIDCWFDRAMRFSPTDPTVRYIYGMYLHRSGEIESALEQYKVALQLNDDNAEVHYNIALLYLERNELELATTHARRAYSMGFPLPGLKRKLREKGIDIS
jgi:Flp pilus assembly protein TadD